MTTPGHAQSNQRMDQVFIEGLGTDALIGVHDWERRVRQPLLFDIEIDFDNHKPGASDALAHTIDYAAVCVLVRQQVEDSAYALLEALIEAVAGRLLDTFPAATAVGLRVHKPVAARALGCADVGIRIRRERDRT